MKIKYMECNFNQTVRRVKCIWFPRNN